MTGPPIDHVTKVALFDLDDTLIDRRRAFESWLAGFAARHRLSPDAVETLRAADDEGYRPREQFFAVARDRLGVRTDLHTLVDEYDEDMPRHAVLHSGVVGGLEALRSSGWRLGIVTNGEGRMQRGKLASTGLDAMVDCVVISAVEGVRKPDPAIFDIALDRLGAKAAYEQAWMIGDNLDWDVAGGSSAGLDTIWVVGGAPERPDGVRPTITCATIGDALAYLSSL